LPIAEDMQRFTSSAYQVLHALDEFRREHDLKLGQIVPVSAQEIADKIGISTSRVQQITADFQSDTEPYMERIPFRGFIQHKALPKLAAVKQ
jgi:hypothetical protein